MLEDKRAEVGQHLTLVGSMVRLDGVKVGGRSISDSDHRLLILVHIAPETPLYEPDELNEFATAINRQLGGDQGRLFPSHIYPLPPEKTRWLMIARLHYSGLLSSAQPSFNHETALALPWESHLEVETNICVYPHLKFAESIAKRQQGLITGTARRSDLNNGWIQISDIERVKQGLEPLDDEIVEEGPKKSGFRFWFK